MVLTEMLLRTERNNGNGNGSGGVVAVVVAMAVAISNGNLFFALADTASLAGTHQPK